MLRRCQYSVTEGIPEMRAWAAARLTRRSGREFTSEEALIVNGSQQGLDFVGKVFLDPGDHVVLENPSYLGAIQAFDAYQARYLTIETDEDGAIPGIARRSARPRRSISEVRLPRAELSESNGAHALAASGANASFGSASVSIFPSSKTTHTESCASKAKTWHRWRRTRATAPVIYLGTGSKVMAPGMRVAWLIIRDQEIREKIVLAKQGADLHSGTFAQYVFFEYVSDEAAFARHVRNDRS